MSELDVECSMCGRVGGPYVGCPRGCEGNPRYLQSRAYTITEERIGVAPKPSRYGDDGDTGPRKSDPLWLGTE